MYTSCLYFNYVKPLLVSETLMSPKFENKTSKVDNSSTTITFNQVKLAYTGRYLATKGTIQFKKKCGIFQI